MPKRKIIIITDGDNVARHVVEEVAKQIGGRCISSSGGNPTKLRGASIVDQIKKAKHDPVLVMVDDNGRFEKGDGEKALEIIANHPDIEVLGAIAVASNAWNVAGVDVNFSIDCNGNITDFGVDKEGSPISKNILHIYGDTVDVLQQLNIPYIVGIGDIGKMNGRDHIRYGAPITRKAVELILERSGNNGAISAIETNSYIQETGRE
ncbi:MAG: stage V sporulation protein AE [Bacilli bacterium]